MSPTQPDAIPIPAHSLVCIVDDEETVRFSLARLLRSAMIPAETFASAAAFHRRAPHDGPWCLVLDVRMPGTDGLELQSSLSSTDAQVIFVTGHGDVPMCAEAMKAGAVDFLLKPVDEEELLSAVTRALTRSAEIRRRLHERSAVRSRLSTLTPREFEVMQRVIAGMLNKQIADDLHSAEKTVKIHRGRVMEKMAVTSVADLVRAAQTAGVSPVFPVPTAA